MKTPEEIMKTPNLLIAHIQEDGGFGEIHLLKMNCSVIWSNGGGWEHVSVAPYKRNYTPSWDDMCRVKDMFWNEEETVVQYHPAKSEYVNNIPNCLHLWRPIIAPLPYPPSIMVGLKKGQTLGDALQEIEKIENQSR